jgi:nucleoside-diphosphate-sugar epimerase
MVHVQDLAHGYVSATKQELSRVILNPSSVIVEMAEAIAMAANLDGKIEKLSIDQGQKQFGHLANAMTLNLTVNNSRIKRLLGWQIHHSPFINDADIYYKGMEKRIINVIRALFGPGLDLLFVPTPDRHTIYLFFHIL